MKETDSRKSSNVANGIVCIMGSPSFLERYRGRLSTLIIPDSEIAENSRFAIVISAAFSWGNAAVIASLNGTNTLFLPGSSLTQAEILSFSSLMIRFVFSLSTSFTISSWYAKSLFFAVL
jgi:hypothetical protein